VKKAKVKNEDAPKKKTSSTTKPKAAKAKAKDGAKAKDKKKDKEKGESKATGGGWQAPMLLSNELAAIVGNQEESRPQVVKKIHAYVKENNLKNEADKRLIILDSKLKQVFCTAGHSGDTIGMFEMNKYLGAHMKKIEKHSPAVKSEE